MKIGILGTGQLAGMLIAAGNSLGFDISCKDNFEDLDTLDLITFENENISIDTAQYIHQRKKLYPSPDALYYSQDRLCEKQFIQSHQIKTAPFYAVQDLTTLKEATEVLGFPLLLKTRRFGYDGKGQYRISTFEEGKKIIEENASALFIAEGLVRFSRELSIIAAKNSSETVFYPLVENHHHEGILRISHAPIQDTHFLQTQAEKIAETLLNALDYRGVLSIELFDTHEGLIVNEIAPRVHNSGHWTIEGSHTSQFENHLRAIADLPLGNTQAKGYSIMINIIGTFPPLSDLLSIPFCHVHDYQKTPRPCRKLGHITLNHEDPELLETLLRGIPYATF